MNGWRLVKLGDIADEVTVGHVGSMAHEYQSHGVPLLRSQNVLRHGFDLRDVKFISSDFHGRLKKSALRPGDVVTVRTGKPGATAVVPPDWEQANCSDLVITRPGKEIDPYWLSYYINSAASGYIDSQLVGAVQQHFNVGSAKSMVLNLPSLAEQRAIAEVLGALDDKIAANTKLAETAATLAITSLAPFKAQTTQLQNLVSYKKVTIDPASVSAATVAHYSLPAFDVDESPEITSPSAIKSSKFSIEEPAVLISKLNPRFPRVWDVLDVPEIPALASTEFLVLEPISTSTSVLWAILSQADFGMRLESKVAGTSGSHQRVKPADLLATEAISSEFVPLGIQQSITSLGASIAALREESRTLAATRDALLPQLMSGKLRVKDIEQTMGEMV